MADLDVYTVGEAAKVLEEGQGKIHYRIRRKQLPGARKLGWFWVIPKAEVHALKEKLDQAATKN